MARLFQLENNMHEARAGSFEAAHDASIVWRYVVPSRHSPEDVQSPKYFRNMMREAAQQRVIGRNAWNKVECIWEDGSRYMLLMIMLVGQDLVQTVPLIHERLVKAQPGRKPNVPEGYKVEFIEGSGWRALSDKNYVVTEKVVTEEEALRAAVDHARSAS